MKKILFITTFFIGIVLLSGCPIPFEDLRSDTFYSENDYIYYPQKDTFKIGDTLWLSFSFPKNIKNESFDVIFEEDSLNCFFEPRLNKITNAIDSSYSHIAAIGFDYDLIFKKGSSNPHSAPFYFIWDKESQKYVNEFGFVLQNTGLLMISDTYIFIDKQITQKGNGKSPCFYSTFQTTGEATLQFYVEE